jgi:translation initiation factor IF-3
MFRGREVTHPERGTALLEKLAGELSEIAVVEQTPLQDGRNMTMMLAPSKAVLAGEKDDKPAEGEAPAAKGGRNGRHNGSADAVPAAAAPAAADPPPAAESAAPAPSEAAESAAPAPSESAAPAPSDAAA